MSAWYQSLSWAAVCAIDLLATLALGLAIAYVIKAQGPNESEWRQARKRRRARVRAMRMLRTTQADSFAVRWKGVPRQ